MDRRPAARQLASTLLLLGLLAGEAFSQGMVSRGWPLRASDGQVMRMRAPTLIAGELRSDGATVIVVDEDVPYDEPITIWLLNGDTDVTGSWGINVRGRSSMSYGVDVRGAFRNWTEYGRPGRPVIVNIVFADEKELMARVLDSGGDRPCDLLWIESNGGGSERPGYQGRGGDVRLRLLVRDTWNGLTWSRTREVRDREVMVGGWIFEKLGIAVVHPGGVARGGARGERGRIHLEMATLSEEERDRVRAYSLGRTRWFPEYGPYTTAPQVVDETGAGSDRYRRRCVPR